MDVSNLSVKSVHHDRGRLERWLAKEENVSCLLSMCQGIVEMPYKQRRASSQVSWAWSGQRPHPQHNYIQLAVYVH